FGLVIAVVRTGALVIDCVVERPVAIQRHPHLATELPVEVLDTAFAFSKLGVIAGGSACLGKKERTAKALGAVAVRVRELKGGVHTQALLTERHAIRGTTTLGMTMGIEGDSRHAV